MDGSCRQLTTRPAKSTTVKAVLHAIDVLDALHVSTRPLGVSELARRTGLSKSTVQHLLVTLASRRLVEQDPASAAWRISWRLYEYGADLTEESDLARCARQQLDQLAEDAEQTALLGVLSEDEVLYLGRSEVSGSANMMSRPGRRSPLHASASGKVLLAYSDDELRRRVLSRTLTHRTPRTIVDADRIREILVRVRTDAFAKADGENEVALSSLSVPVFGPGKRLAAALTLAGPTTRFGPARTAQMLPKLRTAAAMISGLLCQDGPVPQARPVRLTALH